MGTLYPTYLSKILYIRVGRFVIFVEFRLKSTYEGMLGEHLTFQFSQNQRESYTFAQLHIFIHTDQYKKISRSFLNP